MWTGQLLPISKGGILRDAAHGWHFSSLTPAVYAFALLILPAASALSRRTPSFFAFSLAVLLNLLTFVHLSPAGPVRVVSS
jgi:hypothetical protein